MNLTMDYDSSFNPHVKQLRFFEAGKYHNQRFACWGNRTGKTYGVAREIFYHVTGLYPSWWNGYRFSRPVRVMCATENVDMCMKNLVAILFKGASASEKPAINEGFVNREEFNPCKIKDRYIQHVSGGESVIFFKSYKGGAKAMQGFQADIVWLDERPSLEVYTECLMRLAPFDEERTHLIVTTWPEGGYSDIVNHFFTHTEQDYIHGLDDLREVEKNPQIEKFNSLMYYSQASWDDNPFMSEETRKNLEDSTPPHVLEARRAGVPIFGAGIVFYMPQSKYICGYIEPLEHYAYLLAVDPAVTEGGFWGAVLLAHDRDNKILYIIKNYLMSNITKSQHAFNLEKMLPFPQCPVVIDPAGGGEDQKTQQGMADFLKNECGMNIQKATKGKGSVELGITEMCEKILSDQLKIVYNPNDHTGCSKLIEQIRQYARNDRNEIIKANADHIIDAMRYGVTHLHLSKKQSEVNRTMYKNSGYQAESSWY